MQYDFFRFNPQSFETMVQALMQKILGNTAICFGLGPDGGRELAFKGKAPFPNSTSNWDGTWVVQAKFLSRDFHHEDSFTWVSKFFQKEMDKFQLRKDIEPPENYIFVTNAILTPYPIRGGRDKIQKITLGYQAMIPNISIIAYDELCSLLDNNYDVRIAYSELLSAGDALNEILRILNRSLPDIDIKGKEIRFKHNFIHNKNLGLPPKPILGIDFGTSYSISSVMGFNESRQLTAFHAISDKGQIAVPSVVTFIKDGGYIVGLPEFANLNTDLFKTVINVKRGLLKGLEYNIFGISYSSEDVASLIIRSCKTNAEEYFGCIFDEVVISRPVNFSKNSTDALIRSFTQSGLKITRIVNEAAAATLILDSVESRLNLPDVTWRKFFLIVDLGGGTLDIAVSEIGDGVSELLAAVGDNFLGGIDFDNAIFEYLKGKAEHLGLVPNAQLLNALRIESERVKKELSVLSIATILLQNVQLVDGDLVDFAMAISREEFRLITKSLSVKFRKYVSEIFLLESDNQLNLPAPSELMAIVLTGQGTKIFTLKEILRELFPNTTVVESFSETAVARGIAEMAGILQGEFMGNKLLINVTNHRYALKSCPNPSGTETAVISTNKANNYDLITVLNYNMQIPARTTTKFIVENQIKAQHFYLEVLEISVFDELYYNTIEYKIPFSSQLNASIMLVEMDVDASNKTKMTIYFDDGSAKITLPIRES